MSRPPLPFDAEVAAHVPDDTRTALPPDAPRQVRDYRIERQLGRGGMANVYLGRRTGDGGLAAVKMLHPELAKDTAIVQRFLLEMRASATLVHDNVLRLLDWGEHDGSYFLVTEYMDGGSVRDLMVRSGGKVPPPVAEGIVAMLLRALEHAHAAGVIHRDIKPANLMVSSDGNVRLADFGIARTHQGHGLTRTGMLIGTPAYMSPEQAAGRPVDHRSDLFAVGIVLYELLTGINPYASDDNEMATLANVLQSEPRILFELDPTIPPHLEGLATHLLQRDPARRTGSATAALEELNAASPQALSQARSAVREQLHDPVGASIRYASRQAQVHYQRARKLLESGPQGRPRAILELYRTLLLLPEHELALADLREQFAGRDPFGAPANPKILEIEAELVRDPGNSALLLQLASLYKRELAFPKAIACYKRVLKLRPDDAFTAGQLRALVGDELDPTLPTHHPAGAFAGAPPQRAPTSQSLPSLAPVSQARPRTRSTYGPALPSHARSSTMDAPPASLSGLGSTRRWSPLLVLVGAVVAVLAGVASIGRFVSSAREESTTLTTSLERKLSGDTPAVAGSVEARAASIREKDEERLNRAAQALRDGDPDEAERLLLQDADRGPRARLLLGQVYLRMQRPFDAAEELEASLQDAPADSNVPQIRLLLATALQEIGRSDDALMVLDELVDEHPSSPLVTDAFALQATIYEAQGDLETARARYRSVMSRTGPADRRHAEATAGIARIDGALGTAGDEY